MKRTFLLMLLFVLIPFSVGATLTRTLKLGVNGDDVRELQVILNADPYTQVAVSGSGSPGNEGQYFGPLTMQAVMKFQTKYAPEVLFPAGVYRPTGVIGSYGRAKLQSLASKKTTSISPTSSADIPNPSGLSIPETASVKEKSILDLNFGTFSNKKPVLLNLSQYEAKHGQTITIHGVGFLKTDNSVVFSAAYRLDHIATATGTELSVVIPETIPNGSYNLFVENSNGSTYKESFGNYFTITDNPGNLPVVSTISPTVAKYGRDTAITITGTNFASSGNKVYSILGVVENIPSSDGTALTIPFSSFPQYLSLVKNSESYKGSGIAVFVYVRNKVGVSSGQSSFLLQF